MEQTFTVCSFYLSRRFLIPYLWDSSSAFSMGQNDFNDDGVCIFPQQKKPLHPYSGFWGQVTLVELHLIFYHIFDCFYRLPIRSTFYIWFSWVFFVDFT